MGAAGPSKCSPGSALRRCPLQVVALATFLAGRWRIAGQDFSGADQSIGSWDSLNRGHETDPPLLGEVDVSDLLGIGGRGMQTLDADRGLDSGAQRKRMRACLRAVRMRMGAKPEETEANIASLMSQAASSGRQSSEMSEDQIINQIVFSMVMSCYQRIDAASVGRVLKGDSLEEGTQEALFKQWAASLRPTKRQFLLLEFVMKEEQARLLREAGPEDMPGTVNIIGRGMSSWMKVTYLLVVFGVLSSAGYFAIRRVLRQIHRPPRERTAKAMRKVMRAEAKLDKKKLS